MLHSGLLIIFEGNNLYRLLIGLLVTLKIAIIAVLFSIIFGLIFGIIMTSKSILIRFLCKCFLELVRIVPIIVWLFLFYFGLTKVLNIHIDGVVISISVFSIWGTVEMGDLVRGAIISLPKHQKESGCALGLKPMQLYRYIIIPQATKRLIPGAMNLVTRMIKTTSLVVLIGVVEVLKVGQQIIEASLLTEPSSGFWIYGFILFLYFIICYPISLFSKRLEQKWQS